MPYADVPAHLRSWVDEALGSPVVSWSDQVGGMSPGCATRLVAADGTRAFVKAVGAELNPDAPTLFRREIEVLGLIGSDPLWAALIASYDDSGWVGLLLEDVPGGHPDLSDDAEMDALLTSTDRLVERLGEVPVPAGPHATGPMDAGLIDVQARFAAWARALDHLDELPHDLVPPEVRRDPDRLRRLVALLQGGGRQLTHWDIRVDNLLRPAPGRIVFVDWGATGVGPSWVDPLLARLERVDDPWFDTAVRSSPVLAEAGDDVVSAWLVAFGLALAHQSTLGRADVGLPTLNEFRRTQARRLLGAAARRLS
jgi:aminoglycoside phosphotransferase (APT) family kinase protein